MGALMHFSEPFGGDVEKTMQQLQLGGIQQMKAIGKFIYSALYVDSLYREIELDLSLPDILDWLDSSPIGKLQEISEVMAAGITAISEVKTPSLKSFEGGKKK